MVIVALGFPGAARAERISFIRDAEIENTIRTFATPVFEAAGVDPNAVRIYLVKDKALNAFVAGGMNLFINTGLLIRSETAGQVIGVIAHETGHISGGHLARINDAVAGATAESIAAMVLGAAAAVASGRGDVGMAVMGGGSEMAMRNLLSFSRTQESSADQAALSFLDRTEQSSTGLLEFFEILGDQELLVASRQDPYVRTHPLTRERVEVVRSHVDRSPFSKTPPRPDFAEKHRIMRAKLFAFMEPTGRTLQRYREDDRGIDARYARAIAYYRKPDMALALPAVDDLIAERPTDPYFHELKGQMLFENGRAREALTPYREAVRLLPDSALLRISLAQVQIELEDPSLLKEAQTNLEFALQRERDNSFGWRLLSIAHGRAGNDAMASYAMAEHALLSGDLAQVTFHANRAEGLLPKNSPIRLRIADIRAEAEDARAKQKQQKGR